MKKQMVIFMRADTQMFGTRKDSMSTDRELGVTWEVGDVGIRFSRKLTVDGEPCIERTTVPWTNIARYQVIESDAAAEPKGAAKR